MLEDTEGITFNVSKGTNGEFILRAVNIVSNNDYLELPTVSVM